MGSILSSIISKLVTKKVTNSYIQNQKDKPGTLESASILTIIGIIDVFLFLVLNILFLVFYEHKDNIIGVFCGCVVCGLFILLGVCIILYGINFEVSYKDYIITYRNIFKITKIYDSREIKHVYRTQRDGIQLVFNDGRRLKFDPEEKVFYSKILKENRLKPEFKNVEKVIKTGYNSFIKVFALVFMFISFIPFVVEQNIINICIWFPFVLFYLSLYCFYSTYDKTTNILTIKKGPFVKKFDMRQYFANPIYDDSGYLIKIGIYKGKKKVSSVGVSIEFSNRIPMIHALLGDNFGSLSS